MNFNRDDIGELIAIIRVQKCKQTIDGFANRLGFKPTIIEQVEEGKSAHSYRVFNRCVELGFIKDVKLSFTLI